MDFTVSRIAALAIDADRPSVVAEFWRSVVGGVLLRRVRLASVSLRPTAIGRRSTWCGCVEDLAAP
jgi:hypothetical protein